MVWGRCELGLEVRYSLAARGPGERKLGVVAANVGGENGVPTFKPDEWCARLGLELRCGNASSFVNLR